MGIEILYNSTVIGTIIGALIGALSSWILAITTEQYKANKRKEGARTLIQSEIFYMINVFEEFRDKYLKEEIIINEDTVMNDELFNFYGKMSNFPIWTNRNWINLIEYIPEIFNKNEIKEINNFYTKCEETTDNANALAKIEPYETISVNGKIENQFPTSMKTINSHRNMFRTDLNKLINQGNNLKKIFH